MTISLRSESAGRVPMPVVLLHRNPTLFADIAVACYCAGVPVLPLCDIAEIERWPVGQIVVTDIERVTPLWTSVGAAHVLALVDHAAQGPGALQRGATRWLLAEAAPTVVPAFALAAGAPPFPSPEANRRMYGPRRQHRHAPQPNGCAAT